MKKFIIYIMTIASISGTAFASNGNDDNGGYRGYYMGPGMMWNGNDYCYGPGMMGGYWMDNGWNNYGHKNLNLTQQQQSQWDNTVTQGRNNQQAINDSINYYVNEIKRLQRAKSPMVQDDLNQIRQILTPQQYTQFLEKLVTGNPND